MWRQFSSISEFDILLKLISATYEGNFYRFHPNNTILKPSANEFGETISVTIYVLVPKSGWSNLRIRDLRVRVRAYTRLVARGVWVCVCVMALWALLTCFHFQVHQRRQHGERNGRCSKEWQCSDDCPSNGATVSWVSVVQVHTPREPRGDCAEVWGHFKDRRHTSIVLRPVTALVFWMMVTELKIFVWWGLVKLGSDGSLLGCIASLGEDFFSFPFSFSFFTVFYFVNSSYFC